MFFLARCLGLQLLESVYLSCVLSNKDFLVLLHLDDLLVKLHELRLHLPLVLLHELINFFDWRLTHFASLWNWTTLYLGT